MLSNIQKNILLKAVKIRLRNGEELDKILESYAKLTESEKNEIKKLCDK